MNKLSKYRDIVTSIRIDHEAFSLIREEVGFAYENALDNGLPICLLIVGESRTGKSCVVKQVIDTYSPRSMGNKSVLYAVAPPKATLKSLLEALLKGLGDPFWSRGSESNMTQRLYTLLENVSCRMIILDEFQHLCDKGQAKRLNILADWLKVLLEGNRWGLVAVGMPESTSIVNRHPQLAGRFEPPLRMPTFDWKEKNSRLQFKGILKRFRTDLSPFETPPLEDDEVAFRMFLAAAGRVGLVAKLLDRAVKDAIRDGRVQIRLSDLHAAYERAIWASSWFPVEGGPFLADLAAISGQNVMQAVMEYAKQEDVADTSCTVEVHNSSRAEAADAARTNQASRRGASDRSARSPGGSTRRKPSISPSASQRDRGGL